MSAANTAVVAIVAVELKELAEELREQIDGGEERRGRDSRLSSQIRTVEAAATLLNAYSEYQRGVEAMFKKLEKAA